MFHPLEKELTETPLPPSEISTFKTPLPLGISTILRGGEGGNGYFLEPHNDISSGAGNSKKNMIFFY